MPSLFDPDLKRQWAKFRLDEFLKEVEAIQKTSKPKITTEEDVESNKFKVRIQEMYDERFLQTALRAGDFIANLRAVLDHIVWQLALLGGGLPNKNICFPICEEDNSKSQEYIKRSTTGVPDKAVEMIKYFQPYKAGNDFRSTRLWKLNKLWNIDKHRHLTPHRITSAEWQFKINGGTMVESRLLEDGVEYAIPLLDKEKIEFNSHNEIEFAVCDETEKIQLTVTNLVEMYEYVSDVVMPAFAEFFTGSDSVVG
jgi:hypothetical protein